MIAHVVPSAYRARSRYIGNCAELLQSLPPESLLLNSKQAKGGHTDSIEGKQRHSFENTAATPPLVIE